MFIFLNNSQEHIHLVIFKFYPHGRVNHGEKNSFIIMFPLHYFLIVFILMKGFVEPKFIFPENYST